MADNVLRFRAMLDDKVSKQLGTIDAKFAKIGKSSGFKSLTQGIGLGAGVAGFQLLGDAISGSIDFIGDSINASRDLTETLSKSKVVFGDSAKSIDQWGDTAASSMGVSKQAAIEAAASFGNLFTGLGQTDSAAADMSKRLVGLAGDLASFNNMDPTEVLQKLQSGLNGEAEPMRRLGVFLSEAKVKAKAMELGLGNAHGELTEGEKVLARYNIILAETGTAQGDFARTSDGLANSQRRATAELLDAQAKLGESFEPIALEFTKLQLHMLKGFKGIIGNAQQAFSDITTYGHLGIQHIDKYPQALGRFDRSLSKSGDNVIALQTRSKPAFDAVAQSVLDIGEATEETEEKFGNMVDSILNDAQALIDDYYGPIQAKEELLANKAELAAARRVLASKEATAAEKRDAREAITQIEKDNLELRVELLAAGKLSKKGQQALIQDLETKLKKSTGSSRAAIQRLIDKVKELGRVTAPGIDVTVGIVSGSHTKSHHNALGGYLPAGQTSVVGERGPELLTLGSTPGHITPNSRIGTGGGTLVMNVTYAPMYSSASAAETRRFAQSILPELTRVMRHAKLIPQGGP